MRNAAYQTLGAMPMPEDFRYRDVFLRGRPRHERWDSFLLKHPPMPAEKWAKIFSPFDALKGFGEAVASKETRYVSRILLEKDAEDELDRRLALLYSLTRGGRRAGTGPVTVTVMHFVPCADEQNFAFRVAGQYVRTRGTVLNVDPREAGSVTLMTETGKQTVFFPDILKIESGTGLFEQVP